MAVAQYLFGAVSATLALVNLKKIEGIMKKEQYHSILQRHAIPSGINLIGRGLIFQQDNDPKHTSKLCTSYLEQKKVAGDLNRLTPRCAELSR